MEIVHFRAADISDIEGQLLIKPPCATRISSSTHLPRGSGTRTALRLPIDSLNCLADLSRCPMNYSPCHRPSRIRPSGTKAEISERLLKALAPYGASVATTHILTSRRKYSHLGREVRWRHRADPG